MKTTLNLLVALLTVISTTAFATGNKSTDTDENAESKVIVMKGKEPGTVKLLYADKTPKLVRVKIYDKKNHLIHHDLIPNRGGFLRTYDLSHLERSNYLFKISDKTGSVTKQVQNYQPLEEHITGVAMRRFKDKKEYNMIVAADQASIKVKIFDDNENLIHTETIDSESGISKAYDLSLVRSRKFTFLVNVDNKTYKRVTI